MVLKSNVFSFFLSLMMMMMMMMVILDKTAFNTSGLLAKRKEITKYTHQEDANSSVSYTFKCKRSHFPTNYFCFPPPNPLQTRFLFISAKLFAT